MRLSRPVALIIGVLTFGLWVSLIIYVTISVPPSSAPVEGGRLSPDPDEVARFNESFWILAALVLLAFALWAFYIFYLFRTDRVPPHKKKIWHRLLLFANLIAMPVFWWLYMWPKNSGNPRPR